MRDERLAILYRGCSKLFINQGFSRTQMRDIVQQTDIPNGTLYNLFTGKKAMLAFVIKCTIEPHWLGMQYQYPISTDHFPGLEEEVEHTFHRTLEEFSAHRDEEDGRYSYGRMLSDAFDFLSRYAVCCLIFERNPRECGGMGACYERYRACFIDTFHAYVRLFIQRGALRELADPDLSMRLMTETLFWWAMHVNIDAYHADENQVPAEDAKRVCIDALTHAYLR